MQAPDLAEKVLILVVERDPHIKKLERFFLEQAGYRVDLSDNIIVLEMLLGDDLSRTIRIIKSRGSKHDGKRHPLRITQSTVEIEG